MAAKAATAEIVAEDKMAAEAAVAAEDEVTAKDGTAAEAADGSRWQQIATE